MSNNPIPWKALSATVQVGLSTEGWNLAESPGKIEVPRVFVCEILFAERFLNPPVVTVALTGFDLDQRHSGRLNIRALDITEGGFKAEISTWHDSRVYSVAFSWLAIGG